MADAFGNIATALIDTVFMLGSLLFVLRLLLQAARADFYNPISQGVVKGSEPMLRPMRMVVPGFRNFDTASFLAALLVMTLWVAFDNRFQPALAQLFVAGLYYTLRFILNLYWFGLLIVILLSFLAPGTMHPAAILLRQLVEPVLAPVRRLLPPLGGLDFSPIIVFLGIYVLQELLRGLFLGLF